MFSIIQVIEANETLCLTLTIGHATSEFCLKAEDLKDNKEKSCISPLTWKFRWYSEYALLNFVKLLKAMHAGKGDSPLAVRCIS